MYVIVDGQGMKPWIKSLSKKVLGSVLPTPDQHRVVGGLGQFVSIRNLLDLVDLSKKKITDGGVNNSGPTDCVRGCVLLTIKRV